MKKVYSYRKANIISSILYLNIALILGIVLGLFNPLFGAIAIIIFIVIILWIINGLRIVIEIDENNIRYKSLFKDISINWKDVTKIEKNYLAWWEYGLFGEHEPKDLLIKSREGKTIKIFDYLETTDGSRESMEEFMSQIQSYTSI